MDGIQEQGRGGGGQAQDGLSNAKIERGEGEAGGKRLRPVTVKGRVAMLEEKARREAELASVGTRVKRAAVPKVDGAAPVYPLHYKRFTRRTSGGVPLTAKPETPIYRSLPDDEPFIHAPKPTKNIPELRTPEGLSMPTRPDETKSSYFASPGITPAAFLHGTRDNCVRHGRVPPPQTTTGVVKQKLSTQDLAKSRSGIYMPTGISQMRQMEATSPWAGPTKCLATSADLKDEVCPDCANELRIKRREMMQASSETVWRPAELSRNVSQRTLRGISEEAHGDEQDLVISKDLGDGLNAVIFEQEGDLRRVVLNARHGRPTAETMQRLSKELAQVSDELLFACTRTIKAGTPVANDYAVVLDAPPRAHKPSVPELLDLIDEAANDIHTHVGRVGEHYVSRPDYGQMNRNSLLGHSDFNAVMGHHPPAVQGLVDRQGIDEHYRALHERLADAWRRESVKRSDATLAVPKAVPTRRPVVNQAETTKAPAPSGSKLAIPERTSPPRIITTRPTLPQAGMKSAEVSPKQTPPPEHPALHHAAELTQTPKLSGTFPKTPPPPHHSAFGFLNPFNRHPTPTPTTKPTSPPTPSPPLIPQSPPTPATTRIRPADESPPATTPQPISAAATPYHHAPHTPLDLSHAAYSDPKVREQQQVIRAAMRMEKGRAVQEASSAMEREARRKRSLAQSPGQTGQASKATGAGGRRGWFG